MGVEAALTHTNMLGQLANGEAFEAANGCKIGGSGEDCLTALDAVSAKFSSHYGGRISFCLNHIDIIARSVV